MNVWNRLTFEPVPADEWLNRAVEGLLVALLAFGPLSLGVVHAWSEEVVVALAAVMVLLFLIKVTVFARAPLVWTWVYVPILAFLIIATVQLLPLPSAWAASISSNTVTLRTELLGHLPQADEILARTPLSLYPYATKHGLRLLLAASAVFVVVVNVYREPGRIKRLLAALAIIGGAMALLALAQDIVGNGKIYWRIPTYDQASSGTFINHSHYAQFMNLSIGAALALLLVTLQETFAGHHVTPARVATYLCSRSARIVKLLSAAIVFGAATIFLSLSRGGMIAMLIATTFVALVLSSRQSLRSRSWIIILIALAAFVCVLYLGFEQVYSRMATLYDSTTYGGRWQMAKDTIRVWTQFPAVGTGLGTYEVVYPMFDTGSSSSLASHAENEYAQMLAETGFTGIIALAVFGVMIWIHFARSVSVGSEPIRAAAYGLGFGLIAILIHSLSDFGQHLPANLILSTVCCALLVALAARRSTAEPVCVGIARRWVRRIGRGALLLVAVAAFTWAGVGAHQAQVAGAHWNEARLAARHLEATEWTGDPSTYKYLFSEATDAVEIEPDNVYYRHWLGVYKWLSLTPYVDPNSGQLDPQARPWVAEILDDLQQARVRCPTYGATACVIGEIKKFFLSDPSGAEEIEQGYRLAPCDATVCFAAARLDAETDRIEPAFDKLTRAIQLDGAYFQPAAEFCIEGLARPDLALELAADHSGRLGQVANLLGASEAYSELAAQARTRVVELLRERSDDPDASASIQVSLARYEAAQGDLDSAIERYRSALRKDYEQYTWHYELARLLAQTGQTDEAKHEAEICLRLRPGYRPGMQLIQQLSILLPDQSSPLASNK